MRGRRTPEHRWTKAELARLTRLIGSGMTDEEIGAALGLTRWQVYRQRHKMGLGPGTADPEYLGIKDLNTLLGHHPADRRPFRWVARGWLVGRISYGATRHRIVVRHADLLTFMEDPRYWPCWDPARLTDPGLVAWAAHVRTTEPLSLEEAADEIGVSYGTIKGWLCAFPQIPRLCAGERYGQHLHRDTVAAIKQHYQYGSGIRAYVATIHADRDLTWDQEQEVRAVFV